MTHDWRSSWQSFAPLLDAAERFTAAARSYLDESAQGPAAAAARTFSDSLREQWMPLFQLGVASFGAGGAHGVSPAPTHEMPALGLTREHQLRWQRTAESARRMADAQLRLQLLWSDALRNAALAFVARIDPSQSSGGTPGRGSATVPGLYADWIDCAEEAYARIAHSDTFCGALADFVNAGSGWRTELQASAEHWAKSVDLPTRSEVDTLTLRLKSVEEQLRARDVGQPATAERRTRPTPRTQAATHTRGRRSPRGPKP